jgi:hypothetical protein
MWTSRYLMAGLGCAALAVVVGCASPGQSAAGTTGTGRPSSPSSSLTASARSATDAGRPVGEKIPAAAKAVTITEYLGLNSSGKPPAPVTITAPARVRELAAAINGLALFPPGMYSCPASSADGLKLEFSAAPGKAPLAVATDLLSGCRQVAVTIDGKQQPALAGLSAAAIFKIADLPWTVPAGSAEG